MDAVRISYNRKSRGWRPRTWALGFPSYGTMVSHLTSTHVICIKWGEWYRKHIWNHSAKCWAVRMCTTNIGFHFQSRTGLSREDFIFFPRGYRFLEDLLGKVFHFHFQHEGNVITMLRKKDGFKWECFRSVFSNTRFAISHMHLT